MLLTHACVTSELIASVESCTAFRLLNTLIKYSQIIIRSIVRMCGSTAGNITGHTCLICCSKRIGTVVDVYRTLLLTCMKTGQYNINLRAGGKPGSFNFLPRSYIVPSTWFLMFFGSACFLDLLTPLFRVYTVIKWREEGLRLVFFQG